MNKPIGSRNKNWKQSCRNANFVAVGHHKDNAASDDRVGFMALIGFQWYGQTSVFSGNGRWSIYLCLIKASHGLESIYFRRLIHGSFPFPLNPQEQNFKALPLTVSVQRIT